MNQLKNAIEQEQEQSKTAIEQEKERSCLAMQEFQRHLKTCGTEVADPCPNYDALTETLSKASFAAIIQALQSLPSQVLTRVLNSVVMAQPAVVSPPSPDKMREMEISRVVEKQEAILRQEVTLITLPES